MREPRSPFSYAIFRVVPRVERGEQINAGVIVHCRQLDFLEARAELDVARFAAIAPDVPPDDVRAQLDAIVRVAAGDPTGGAIAAMPAWERFDWLVAPSSTMIQPSETHTGLTSDPRRTLEELFTDLVRPVREA